jgi:hypothetical protein
MKHGGKRAGAGRKPAPAGTTKVPYGTKLTPQVVEYLKGCDNAAQAIEDSVRASPGFKRRPKE